MRKTVLKIRHYADNSFLVSCYIADANTPQAKAYLLESGATFAFTPEILGAFNPESHKGHKMQAKALLLKTSNGDRINLTSLEMAGLSCAR